MNLWDYLILALIVGYCLFLLFRKKKPACHGNCGGCSQTCEKKGRKTDV